MPTYDNAPTGLCESAQDHVNSVKNEILRVDASNQEVTRFANDAATVATSGIELAESTHSTFAELGTSTEEIGEVIRLIDNVAGDTHLLALNATIEAARAGEAGKGFAVVAAEVKQLATKTASATQQVSQQISAIQSSARKSIEAMESIVQVVTRIAELQASIASEIQEQDGMTQTIQDQIAGLTANLGEITEQSKIGSAGFCADESILAEAT